MTAIIAGIITFAFTTLLTIAGVGAAFILIPVFIALGIELHAAMATALLLNSISMSVASVNFIRKKLVVWKIAIPILIIASALSPIGAIVSQQMDRNLLLWLFVGFLVFAAAMMLFYTPRLREGSYKTGTLLGVGMSVGGAAGFLGGLLGVGGGNFIVPALVGFGFDPKKASATTAFVVIFASFSGFLGHVTLGGMNYSLLGFTAVGSAAGAALGSYLMSDKLKGRQVKIVIGLVLIGIAAKMVWGLL
jgi:uncharacterized membrane protein YfcA